MTWNDKKRNNFDDDIDRILDDFIIRELKNYELTSEQNMKDDEKYLIDFLEKFGFTGSLSLYSIKASNHDVFIDTDKINMTVYRKEDKDKPVLNDWCFYRVDDIFKMLIMLGIYLKS